MRPAIQRYDRYAVATQYVDRLYRAVGIPDQIIVAVEVELVDHQSELAAIDAGLLPASIAQPGWNQPQPLVVALSPSNTLSS